MPQASIGVLPTSGSDAERICAIEFKWSDHAKVRIPKIFRETYPDANVRVVSRDDVYSWLTTSPMGNR